MNWRDHLSTDEAARLVELYAARRANQVEINRIAKRCRKRMERATKEAASKMWKNAPANRRSDGGT